MIPEIIRQRLIDKYDPDVIIDLLGLTTEELIEYLEEPIMENLTKLDLVLEDDTEEI